MQTCSSGLRPNCCQMTLTSMIAPLPSPHTHKYRPLESLASFSRPLKQQRIVKSRRNTVEVKAALFDPPPFDPAKLTVRYLPCLPSVDSLHPRRRYTLTHNDLTGSLKLSIGSNYNEQQVSGWYTRILRDEVLAEWHIEPQQQQQPLANNNNDTGTDNAAVLHVYCHVSGEANWLAPPSIRSFIFQREMTLVLDTIRYADKQLIESDPRLLTASVVVHLASDQRPLNRVVQWGKLNDRQTWQKTGGGMLQQVVSSILSSFSSMDEEIMDPLESADLEAQIAASTVVVDNTISSDNGDRETGAGENQQQQQKKADIDERASSSSSFSNGSEPMAAANGTATSDSTAGFWNNNGSNNGATPATNSNNDTITSINPAPILRPNNNSSNNGSSVRKIDTESWRSEIDSLSLQPVEAILSDTRNSTRSNTR